MWYNINTPNVVRLTAGTVINKTPVMYGGGAWKIYVTKDTWSHTKDIRHIKTTLSAMNSLYTELIFLQSTRMLPITGTSCEPHGVPNHRKPHCLLDNVFRLTTANSSKLRITGRSQRAVNAESVCMPRRHYNLCHTMLLYRTMLCCTTIQWVSIIFSSPRPR